MATGTFERDWMAMIGLAEGLVHFRGTLSVGTGTYEERVQGSIWWHIVWYVPDV